MRQYEKLDGIAEKLCAGLNEALVGLEGDRLKEAEALLKRLNKAQCAVRPYRRLLKAQKLGTIKAEFTEEEARKIYYGYIAMLREIELRYVSPEQFTAGVPEFRYD